MTAAIGPTHPIKDTELNRLAKQPISCDLYFILESVILRKGTTFAVAHTKVRNYELISKFNPEFQKYLNLLTPPPTANYQSLGKEVALKAIQLKKPATKPN